MQFLDMSQKSGKKMWLSLKHIQGCAVRDKEVVTEPKSSIIGSKGTVEKKWMADLMLVGGVSISVQFDTEEQAEKWLKENVIEA